MLSDCSLTDMAVHLRLLLILAGLTGIHTITQISEVPVKAGDSSTIPCLYDRQHRNQVKYLCKGGSWLSCSTKVRTDSQRSSRKFSISDDKILNIFTVTVNDLKNRDTDYYWCVVEIGGGADVGDTFHLSVTGRPHLYVDHQEISGFKGDNINIKCHYQNSGERKWCKLGGSCVTKTSGSIDGTRVSIDVRLRSVFTVTMSDLRTESSGWYVCVRGDLQMPVHVTVTDRPTTTLPTTILPTTLNHIHPDKAITTVKNEQYRASFDIESLIISLILLISVVIVALLIWFMLKKHKWNKAESSDATPAEEEVIYCNVRPKRKSSSQAEEDVTYCNVGIMTKTSSQRSYAGSDVDVTYSSVIPIKQQNVEAEDDVTYSTLAQH